MNGNLKLLYKEMLNYYKDERFPISKITVWKEGYNMLINIAFDNSPFMKLFELKPCPKI